MIDKKMLVPLLVIGGVGYYLWTTTRKAEATTATAVSEKELKTWYQKWLAGKAKVTKVERRGVTTSAELKVGPFRVGTKFIFFTWPQWTGWTGLNQRETVLKYAVESSKYLQDLYIPRSKVEGSVSSAFGYPFAKKGRALERILTQVT